MDEKQPFVYIMASKRNGTLYIGVTGYPIHRTYQHREHLIEGFTKRYGVSTLVYYELHESMDAAIQREKRIKKYTRTAKMKLIEKMNPHWEDLWDKITA